MSDSSDDEYELLPTYDDRGQPTNSLTEKRRIKGGKLRQLRRTVQKYPLLTFFALLSLILVSCTFLALDIVYLEAKLAIAGSYNAFVGQLWPVGLPNRTDMWENENSRSMHALMTCMTANNCTRNQDKIVLLSSPHFANSISGHVSGEDIWAMSILDAVRELGYTPIFTTDNEELARTYRQYPQLVKVVILEGESARKCFMDSRCIKTLDHPLGIPAWKMFSFHFWDGSSNPLGNAWTLSPENYALISPKSHSEDNIYLGYSIERTCMQIPVTPIDERPRQAYILAKNTAYFYGNNYAWPGLRYELPPMDINIVAGIRSYNAPDHQGLPKGIVDLGHLDKQEFYHHIGNSRVLIGVGQPWLSPSPYDALCMGLPFINPVVRWDKNDPDNRTSWATQHDGLKYQHPPYVYHVKRADIDGFWDALRTAMETPIERYIIPEMTMTALKSRVSIFIEGNWREKAEKLLAERTASGKGQLFEL